MSWNLHEVNMVEAEQDVADEQLCSPELQVRRTEIFVPIQTFDNVRDQSIIDTADCSCVPSVIEEPLPTIW
jgi:hypothetical protein